MEKERAKALQKKLERDEAQKHKAASREAGRAQRRDAEHQLALSPAAPAAASASQGKPGTGAAEARAAALATPETDAQRAANAPAPAASEKPKSGKREKSRPQLDEAELKKLFGLLDRSGKGKVTQRDVLVALRKLPPARRLFGFPDGGPDLEARIQRVQEAFEGGEGLGELKAIFDELRAGDAEQVFGWEAFAKTCKGEPHRARAIAAISIIPREHAMGEAFVPTRKWQIVPQGAACPGGLEYKMDVSTGKTLGRIPPSKAA